MQYFSDKIIAHTAIFPQSSSTSLAALFEVNCAAYPGKACFLASLGYVFKNKNFSNCGLQNFKIDVDIALYSVEESE
jgi:hypothetical protein